MAQTIREIDTRSIDHNHKMEVIYARKMFSIQYDGFPITTILNEYPKYTYGMIEQIISNEGGYIDNGIVRRGVARLPHNEDVDGRDLIDPKYGRTKKGRPLGKLDGLVMALEGRPIFEAFQFTSVVKAKASYEMILKAIDNQGGYVDDSGIVRRK